jgi:hypothetical protein
MAYNTGSDPTLAELITGKFIPEVYSKDVIMHTKSNLVIAQNVNTSYRDDLRMGYKVNIPVFSEVTTSEVTPGTEPTAQDAAGTPVSITVDKWREATVEISEMSQLEQNADYLKGAAESCAYAISKYVDTTLSALFSTLSSSSVYGSDGQSLTDDIILALMETLDESDVPPENRCIIADPSSKSDLLTIDKFVRNDYVREPVVATGKFGNIYNMGVFITNNLTASTTGNYGVMMHKDAIGLVMQKNPISKMIPMPWKFINRIIVQVIFGVGELRDSFGRAFYTRSK